eukprot:Seg1641.14 transcript_id=Seg1641.14/GoldUCD/mRNA.D3Y31 product="hypothetical protein" protein_id=Seg1641.14/GoldUCD/D3Y31
MNTKRKSLGRGKSLIDLFNSLKESGKRQLDHSTSSLNENNNDVEPKENARHGSADAISDSRVSLVSSDSNTDVSETGCICERKPSQLSCRHCGHIFVGRRRRICAEHRNIIHLMDVVVCMQCGNDLSD